MTIEETLYEANKKYVIAQGDEDIANSVSFEEFIKNSTSSDEAKEMFTVSLDAMKTYAKQQSIEFFKWNALKIDGYIKYVEQIKPLVTSLEIEEALNIFEGSTIEERYDLFIQSNAK